jgi:hypothetical protein
MNAIGIQNASKRLPGGSLLRFKAACTDDLVSNLNLNLHVELNSISAISTCFSILT